MRVLRLASSSGVNLLKIGAMTVGYSTIISNWKPLHTHQAQNHHSEPVVSMSFSTTHTSGRPMAAPTRVPFTMSAIHKPGVILLKPKRCSSTNWR